jgi:hypothetical protein
MGTGSFRDKNGATAPRSVGALPRQTGLPQSLFRRMTTSGRGWLPLLRHAEDMFGAWFVSLELVRVCRAYSFCSAFLASSAGEKRDGICTGGLPERVTLATRTWYCGCIKDGAAAVAIALRGIGRPDRTNQRSNARRLQLINGGVVASRMAPAEWPIPGSSLPEALAGCCVQSEAVGCPAAKRSQRIDC